VQKLSQLAVGGGDLGPAVDQEDDVRGPVERDPGLLEDFTGDGLGFVRENAPGVDQLEPAPAVGGLTVDAVARDARLVADNGAPLPENRIEEGGFPNVRPAYDGHYRQARRPRHEAI